MSLAAPLTRRLPATRPDPIDHPAIAAMSLRELADLPLPRSPSEIRFPPRLPPRRRRAWERWLWHSFCLPS